MGHSDTYDKWRFRSFEVPDYMRESIEEYVQLGSRKGDFLSAIICNDLKMAVMYADDVNMVNIPAYVNYFYNSAPGQCWGGKKEMDDWIERGGLIGIRMKRERILKRQEA